MSELRQDPTTGEWVIIAPERGRRPHGAGMAQSQGETVAYDPACPFCPGNESQLPGILDEVASPEPPGWRARTVPNRYPALLVEAGEAADARGQHILRRGYGFHEVIIESPRHDADLDMLGDDAIRTAVHVWRDRYVALIRRPRIESVVLFRNRGRRAGATLAHPHAQVIALPQVPSRLRSIGSWARARHAKTRRCPTCAEIAVETAEGARIVDESAHFVLMVPFAAASPFTLKVVPKRHGASFDAAEPEEIDDLGLLVRAAIGRMKAVLGDHAYNCVVVSAPRRQRAAEHLHWFLHIVPDLVRPGGFELGSGLSINPSAPESDAAALRGAAAGCGGSLR